MMSAISRTFAPQIWTTWSARETRSRTVRRELSSTRATSHASDGTSKGSRSALTPSSGRRSAPSPERTPG